MADPTLPGMPVAPPRPVGRPKGSTNKRAGDLMKMVAAVFGSTPGEQMARIGLVTPAEVRRARPAAKLAQLDPLLMALVVKARRLSQVLECTPKEAWELLLKERSELMPYIHQRRPQAVELEVSTKRIPQVMIPEALGPLMPVLDGQWTALESDDAGGLGAITPTEKGEGDAPDVGTD
jgi:hypothetical protein